MAAGKARAAQSAVRILSARLCIQGRAGTRQERREGRGRSGGRAGLREGRRGGGCRPASDSAAEPPGRLAARNAGQGRAASRGRAGSRGCERRLPAAPHARAGPAPAEGGPAWPRQRGAMAAPAQPGPGRSRGRGRDVAARESPARAVTPPLRPVGRPGRGSPAPSAARGQSGARRLLPGRRARCPQQPCPLRLEPRFVSRARPRASSSQTRQTPQDAGRKGHWPLGENLLHFPASRGPHCSTALLMGIVLV